MTGQGAHSAGSFGTWFSTICTDGEKHPKLYVQGTADLRETTACQRRETRLTCNGSNLDGSWHCPWPAPLSCHSALLLRFREEKSEFLMGSTFSFLWPDFRAASEGAPKRPPPPPSRFVPWSPYWFPLGAGQSLWEIGILHPLHVAVPSPVTYSGWRGKEDDPEEQGSVRVIDTIWAPPRTRPSLDR